MQSYKEAKVFLQRHTAVHLTLEFENLVIPVAVWSEVAKKYERENFAILRLCEIKKLRVFEPSRQENLNPFLQINKL